MTSGLGSGHVGGLRHVVVGGADAFDQVVVVVFALAVHDDAHVAAAKLRGGVEFALRAGREGKKLLIILRGEREFADGGCRRRIRRWWRWWFRRW